MVTLLALCTSRRSQGRWTGSSAAATLRSSTVKHCEHMRAWQLSVTVAARVARVRPRRAGGWRVRLTETGGALGAAEIRPSNPLPMPPRGAWITVGTSSIHWRNGRTQGLINRDQTRHPCFRGGCGGSLSRACARRRLAKIVTLF
jgi:hypothetical protein